MMKLISTHAVSLVGKMGYNLYITADGDSLTSYTLYQSRDRLLNVTGLDVGIYPVALFKTTQTEVDELPVSKRENAKLSSSLKIMKSSNVL